MKSVIKLNKISPTIVDRLLESEFLYNDMSSDETFLRLCFYYQELPLFFNVPEKIRTTYFEQVTCKSLITMLESKQLPLTLIAISEILGIPVKYLEKLAKSLGIRKLVIPTDSILYGMGGRFYSPSDIYKLLRRLAGDIDNGKISAHESNRHRSRIITGWELIHPEGTEGIKAARDLVESEFQKLLNPPTPIQELSYDNIDYSKLDWRKVCNQTAFKHLRILYACPNNEYLSEYLSAEDADRTDKLLAELYEKASKSQRKRSDELETTTIIKEPPKPSKLQQEFDTCWQMMHHPDYAKEIFDFLDIHNTYHDAEFQLATIEEFVEHLRKFSVDMLHYGCPGGNVFMDIKTAYTLNGSPQTFKFAGAPWTIKEFFDDFNICFEKQLTISQRDNLQGAAIWAVSSTEIVKYFEIMSEYIKNPSIKPK